MGHILDAARRLLKVRNSKVDLPFAVFLRRFCILPSAFFLRPRVFTISILNSTPLSRRPRGALPLVWYHPGPTLYP
jgi:hypothetical protein